MRFERKWLVINKLFSLLLQGQSVNHLKLALLGILSWKLFLCNLLIHIACSHQGKRTQNELIKQKFKPKSNLLFSKNQGLNNQTKSPNLYQNCKAFSRYPQTENWKSISQYHGQINNEISLYLYRFLLLLLLSRFSCARLCATPQMVAHQIPPSLGFSRQEHWSGLPFPSPMHESEKLKWGCSIVSNSLSPHGLQPTRLLHPWDFPSKSTRVGCHCLLCR